MSGKMQALVSGKATRPTQYVASWPPVVSTETIRFAEGQHDQVNWQEMSMDQLLDTYHIMVRARSPFVGDAYQEIQNRAPHHANALSNRPAPIYSDRVPAIFRIWPFSALIHQRRG